MGCGQSAEDRFQDKIRNLVESILVEGDAKHEFCNPDTIFDSRNFKQSFRDAGVESCSLIVGIDFTRSNISQGESTFHGASLHALDSEHGPNPYERALDTISKALEDFDDDGMVPAYLFGDVETKHLSIKPLLRQREVVPHKELVNAYRSAAAKPLFSGPTSFAPLIDKAVEIVQGNGNAFHILLILADGGVDETMGCLESTRKAIVSASRVPLSIVMIGVGDGPWDVMRAFDDELPERTFDNFQFVPFAKFHEVLGEAGGPGHQSLAEAAFLVCAFQEVPEQYKALKALGLLGTGSASQSVEPSSKRVRVDDEATMLTQRAVGGS